MILDVGVVEVAHREVGGALPAFLLHSASGRITWLDVTVVT